MNYDLYNKCDKRQQSMRNRIVSASVALYRPFMRKITNRVIGETQSFSLSGRSMLLRIEHSITSHYANEE